MLKIDLHPAAAEETEAAFDWYQERNARVAQAFLSQLSHAISRISDSPATWPPYISGTRRYIFPQFPLRGKRT